jgi:hypothetical protein
MITSILHETKIELFRHTREEVTEMQKEYRDAIIKGVVFAIVSTIPISLIQGKVAWAFLFTSAIIYPILKLYLNKRREVKKDEDVQRRE